MPDLTPRERKVLSALLAQEEPAPNLELWSRARIRIQGTERRRLNQLGLIESRRQGRQFIHELTGTGAEALITAAYRELAPARGEFVGLRELRERLPGAARLRVDRTLKEMYAAQRVNLVPRSNQMALSDADRAAAIRLGGEHKHMISIER